ARRDTAENPVPRPATSAKTARRRPGRPALRASAGILVGKIGYVTFPFLPVEASTGALTCGGWRLLSQREGGFYVPGPACCVVGAYGEGGAVRCECYGVDAVGAARGQVTQAVRRTRVGNVPQNDRAVETACRHSPAVRGECDGPDVAGVAR